MRKQTAETFLADRTLSVAEVAFLLGFSEPGAFHRAFKRCHNTTPDAFRKQRSTARQADALRNAEHSGSLPSVFRRPQDRLNRGLQLRWRIRFSQASTAVTVF
jgi:AraC-like DNA-binding protein